MKNLGYFLSNNISEILISILALALVLSIPISIYYFATAKDLTPRESVMLSILLTFFSVFASWLISHIYAKYQYQKGVNEIKKEFQENLKTYALKASEKVDNLSNELAKLAVYLQEELDSESENLDEDLLSKKERMQSAIHIINTLKSVNDKSLSDWKGVIPEELSEKEEKETKDFNEIKSLIQRYQDLYTSTIEDHDETSSETIDKLQNELRSLKNDVDYLTLFKLGIAPRRKLTRKPLRETIETKCPYCNTPIKYKQRPMTSSYKDLVCNNCGGGLIAKWNDLNGFTLNKVELISEIFKCPNCGEKIDVELSNKRGLKALVECKNCSNRYRLVRRVNNFDIESTSLKTEDQLKPIEISEELIDKVKEKLPKQPWPTGTSKIVADSLGLNNSDVAKIIQILIDRGIFKVQINGKLYDETKAKRTRKSIKKLTSEK